MQNALKSAGMSFQAAARASRDTCSDLMHVSKAPAVNDLSPIISALAFARVSHAFLMSMLGRLLSFAIVANVVKTTTAAERAIVGFGIMFFSYLCKWLRGLSHCRPFIQSPRRRSPAIADETRARAPEVAWSPPVKRMREPEARSSVAMVSSCSSRPRAYRMSRRADLRSTLLSASPCLNPSIKSLLVASDPLIAVGCSCGDELAPFHSITSSARAISLNE